MNSLQSVARISSRFAWRGLAVAVCVQLFIAMPSQAAVMDGLFGTSTGTLYRYDHETQTVTGLSSGWGTFQSMVQLSDGRALFGASANGGTLGISSHVYAMPLATGLGTFQTMTSAGNGAVYGTTSGGGTIGAYNGSAVYSGPAGLGTFYASDGLGNGNAMVSYSATGGTVATFGTQANLLQTVVTGKIANTITGALGTTGNAWYGVSADQRPYFWNGTTATGLSSSWGSITTLSAMSDTRAAMGAGGSYAAIMSTTGYSHYESGWGTISKLVTLTNGNAFGGATYNGGSPVLYTLGGNDTFGVGGGNYGTFQQMIALDNGYAVFGSDPAGGVDGQYLAYYDGSGVRYSTNGGLGWGTFELLVDLGGGDVLVGTNRNGGSLFLLDTQFGSFGSVTEIASGLGSFQQGVAVAAVPEPAAIALWGMLGIVGIGFTLWRRGAKRRTC